MAEFLSDEWLVALDVAARAAPPVDDVALVVAQVVRGAHDGDVAYAVVFAPGGARVEPGPALTADVTLIATYETAVAISTGAASAQRALVDGSLQVRGDLDALRRNARALALLGDLFASVRASTSYP